MALLDILAFPHPVLKQTAETVEGLNPELEKLIADMTETMYHAPGVGLAATQVGVTRRVAVVDVSSPEEPKELLALINPEIVESEGLEEMEEGCLSLPEFREAIKRPTRIKVLGKNLKGEPVEIVAGFPERVRGRLVLVP